MKIANIIGTALCHHFKGGSFRSNYGIQHGLGNIILQFKTENGIIGFGEVIRAPAFWNQNPMSQPLDKLPDILQQFIDKPIHSLASMSFKTPDSYQGIHCLKYALETALYDILGKATSQPLYGFLGKKKQKSAVHYFSLSSDNPDAMFKIIQSRAKHAPVIQMKVVGQIESQAKKITAALDAMDKKTKLLVDSNGCYTVDDACALIGLFTDYRIWWEEPCKTYEMNREVAEITGAPLVLDQCMRNLNVYTQACIDGFAAGVGIKPSNLGGLSKARIARDICMAHGISLKIDDSWSGDISTAATLHLSLGVPEKMFISTCCLRNQFEEGARFSGIDELTGFRLLPSDLPGLGLDNWKDRQQPPLFSL